MEEIKNILKLNLLKEFDLLSIEPNSRELMENYLDKAKLLLNHFATQNGNKIVPIITICTTSSISIEDFVCRLQGKNHYLIALSYGLFANLYSCYAGLLAHREILPSVGINPHNTKCIYNRADNGLIDFTFHNEAVKAHTPFDQGFPIWNYPKDDERLLYVTLLCDIAFEYILYHEWGHILGGNVDYMRSTYGVDEITELADKPTDIITGELIMGEPIRKPWNVKQIKSRPL